MAEKLGITVEFKGQTTEFEKAVKSVNNELRTTKSEIGNINKQLKLDPTSVELLSKKFDLLNDKSKELTQKVKLYQDAIKNMPQDQIGSDEWVKLNRELGKAQTELAQVNDELKKMPTANVQALAKQLEETEKKLEKISKGIENVAKKFTVLTGVISGLATAGIKYNAELERQTALFTGLTGSVEEAEKVLSNIKQDAIKSPFDTQALISANQYLIASGIEAEKSRETINALGNAIASTGGGNSELQRMAQNLQQIQNVGKASTMDLRQFAMAGIDVWGILADSTGKTVKELQNMTITYDMLSEALMKASDEGGRYAGGMSAQADTLNGKLSKLKSTFQELLGELTEVLMPVVKNVIDTLQGWVDALKSLDNEQKNTIVKIAGIVASIGPVLMIVAKITGAIGTLAGAIKTILGSQALTTFITSVTSAGGGLSAVLTTIGSKLAFLVNPITALVAGFALLYAKSKTFRTAVNNLASTIAKNLTPIFETLKTTVLKVIDGFMNYYKTIMNLLMPLIRPFVNSISSQINVLSSVANVILSIVRPAIESLIKLFGNIITKALEVASSLISKLQPAFDIVGKVVQLVANYFQILANDINKITKPAIEGIKTLIQQLTNDIKNVVDWVQKLFNKFANTSWGQGFMNIVNSIKSGLDGLLGVIGNVMGWLDSLIAKTNNTIALQNGLSSSTGRIRGGSDVMNSGGLGITMNIHVDNNGTPIDENEINRWVDVMTERIDMSLGRRL